MARKRRSRASRGQHQSSGQVGTDNADADASLLGSSLDDPYLDNLLADLDRLSMSPSAVHQTSPLPGSVGRRRSNRPALHPITSIPTSPAAGSASVPFSSTPLHPPPPETPSAVVNGVTGFSPAATDSGLRGSAGKASKRRQYTPMTPPLSQPAAFAAARTHSPPSSTPHTPLQPSPSIGSLRSNRPVSPSPAPRHARGAGHDSDSDVDPDDPAILAATAAQRRRREQKRAKRSKRQQQQLVHHMPFSDVLADDTDVELSDTESIVDLRMEVEALFVHSQMQVLCPWYLPMFDLVKVEREEAADKGTPEWGQGGLSGFVGARRDHLERMGPWAHPKWDCLVPAPDEVDEWRWVVAVGDAEHAEG